ncbi:hypothetical protein UFOVP723_106 [uncultured Caudovirales phage]|uniref:Uncharacterized protein n=1 Tax=uncultured Caudovirales phage TaxID=2100421 RepID=A0A6J5NND7_9CAUD|nr:hypothetical protein UFOVP723_106 [uncultured Caudovirales phage]
MLQKPLSISHISDDLKTVTPIQMYPPVIPNLRDTQDHMQWHTILDMLHHGDTDTLIPKYIIEYFETVYQRRLIIPNDCRHIEVDTKRKYMKVPATCYEGMSLMYSEESACWYTFIQSVKQPDKVAVIRVWIKGFDGRIPPIEETCCGVGYNILDGWDIEFPFLHRYIHHYNKAMMLDSGHSAGQISKFANTYSTTGAILSKLYNTAPRVVPGTMGPDLVNLQDKLMKEFMANIQGI